MRLMTLVLAVTSVTVMSAEAPQGWYKAGSQRDAYDIGFDSAGAHRGKGSGYIKSTADVDIGKFGTMMQNIKADNYKGKKVRLSAFMRTSGAEQGAWLWLRIDDTDSGWLDNMHDRLVKGTTDWQRYELVLPVSPTAVGIAFGIGLSGRGQAWIDDIKIEAVDPETPKTGNIPELRHKAEEMEQQKKLVDSYNSKPTEGVNLDFENQP
jgi:hypothetical protein